MWQLSLSVCMYIYIDVIYIDANVCMHAFRQVMESINTGF